MSSRRLFFLAVSALLSACGSGGSTTPDAGPDAGGQSFELGGEGVDDPLGSGPNEARAGRIDAEELPSDASEYLTWRAGDFVLANDRVAIVIEDAGPSDLYDPWGGKPVGLGRVEGGALVDPADFGEIFFLTGRHALMTEHVGVVADGSDGGAAIVRAVGRLRPLPFIDELIKPGFSSNYDLVYAAF
ncbi:MAG: hypothetical protein H5U40_02215, partial [Polyangiaceae bacterium]|nr:hypothetical protein [Polyangiaceae bacterium]